MDQLLYVTGEREKGQIPHTHGMPCHQKGPIFCWQSLVRKLWECHDSMLARVRSAWTWSKMRAVHGSIRAVLFSAAGSVATVKLPLLCQQLGHLGELKVVTTKTAKHFIDAQQLPPGCTLLQVCQ